MKKIIFSVIGLFILNSCIISFHKKEKTCPLTKSEIISLLHTGFILGANAYMYSRTTEEFNEYWERDSIETSRNIDSILFR